MSKKEDILNAALTCFAEQGISATTTKQIANAAAVSEALIFKHYTSKQNLIDAIMVLAKKRAEVVINEWEKSEHPKLIIKSILREAVGIDYHDFKLLLFLNQFKDWDFLYSWNFTLEFNEKILKVFHQIGVTDPKQERTLFWMHLYGIVLYKKHFDIHDNIALYEQLTSKYQV